MAGRTDLQENTVKISGIISQFLKDFCLSDFLQCTCASSFRITDYVK